MRLLCRSGKYCHPQFTVVKGEHTPELSDEEALRICMDFPDQFEMEPEPPAQDPVTDRDAPPYSDRMVTNAMFDKRDKRDKRK